MKQKKKSSVLELVKAARKQSREEEIKAHGKSINYQKVMTSKNVYNRKKNKADDEFLPYFFIRIGIDAVHCVSSTKSKPFSPLVQTWHHQP